MINSLLIDPVPIVQARDAVKHHVNLKEQLDRSLLTSLSETVSHSISKLRPLTSNPDFDKVFNRLEELIGLLHTLLSQLEILWERKGEMLDRVLQYKIFETDAFKVSTSFSFPSACVDYSCVLLIKETCY